MKIRLEIDDFGTGYSSLSYLQRLPSTSFKIDRSSSRTGHRKQQHDIVKAILELGHSFGMEVIAEGVEQKGNSISCASWVAITSRASCFPSQSTPPQPSSFPPDLCLRPDLLFSSSGLRRLD